MTVRPWAAAAAVAFALLRSLPLATADPALAIAGGPEARNAEIAAEPASTHSTLRVAEGGTALDRFIAAGAPNFCWKVVSRRDVGVAVELVVDLTSQSWRDGGEVDRRKWKHWLTIVAPKAARSDVALLFIGGGTNDSPQPNGPTNRARALALATQSVVAEFGQVPNQPLEIGGDGRLRKEDDLLARTWVEFIKTGDATWPGQLPMTRAAVSAMDAIEQATAAEKLPAVQRFVVAGGSKRGWTTWLAAAVDTRVVGIAPIVIDLVNIPESMRNHHAAYGFWAPALGSYEKHHLTDLLANPLARPLINLVDPYAYRDRMTMPKCIINASGDQFFTPDSSRFYFDDLPGEKMLCYVANANHSVDGPTAVETLTAFHASIVSNLPRPKMAWTLDDDGRWVVSCSPRPREAILWQAVNEQARDFRVESIGHAYKRTDLSPTTDGQYVGGPTKPAKGYAAGFIELVFDIGAPSPLHMTTPVHVTPDTLPFAE